MTVHRDRFLVNETTRRIEFQFYLYYDYTCFGQSFRPSSGVLSRYILLLVAHGHQICIKCTIADVRLRTPDDGRKDCPKHVES